MPQRKAARSSTETVKSAALTLECVDHVHCSHGLPAGVFGVRNRVADHVFEEHFQYATGLLVDKSRNALHATAASQTADCGLGDALDVVPQHFAMALGTTLAKTLPALSAPRHFCSKEVRSTMMREETICGSLWIEWRGSL